MISIHLMLMLIVFDVPYIVLQRNFNTSHVNVNRLMYSFTTIGASISIHLMLMLIVIITAELVLKSYFNTSHVNVNQNFLIIPLNITPLFQYISC